MAIMLGFGSSEVGQRRKLGIEIIKIILKYCKIRTIKIDGKEYKETTYTEKEIEKITEEIGKLAGKL